MSVINKFSDAEEVLRTPSCVDTECNLISTSEISYHHQNSSCGSHSKFMPNRICSKAKRLRKERFLFSGILVFSAMCLISVIVLFLTFSTLTQKYSDLDNVLAKLSSRKALWDDNRKTEVCKTSSCFKGSQFQMKYLNETIEPCSDFLEFACGSWFERDKIDRDHFTTAYEKMLQDISDLLIANIDDAQDSKMMINFKKYYQSCINQTDIEIYSDVHFNEYMTNEFGPWKMLLNTKSNTNNLENTKKKRNDEYENFGMSLEEKLAKLTSLRLPLLFRFVSDEFNSSSVLMKLTSPQDFCIMQSFLPSNPDTERSFMALMKSIRSYMLEAINSVSHTKLPYQKLDLQIEEGQIDFENEVKEMLELANIVYFVNDTRYKCGRRNNQSEPSLYTIDELDSILTKAMKEAAPSLNEKFFDFQKYVGFLNEKTTSKLNSNRLVSMSQRSFNYFIDMFKELAKTYSSDRSKFMRSFQNLIHFHSVYSMIQPMEVFSAPHLHVIFPIRYYGAFYEYSKISRPQQTSVDFFKQMYRIKPEQNCAQSVIDSFSVSTPEGREFQRIFLTKKFDVNIKKMAQEMLQELIRTSFDVISKQSWIDSHTKLLIYDHIKHMEQRIVYSDAIFSSEADDMKMTLLNKDYHNLTTHFILNKLMLRNKDYETEFDLLDKKPIERIRSKDYVFDIFLANLMYLDAHNTLLMPAGVLIEPIFDKENPVYLNLATIGVYMSHELWHLVQEVIFASNSTSTKQAYIDKLSCLVRNYRIYAKSKFSVDISGTRSAYEQIADVFGFHVAYLTYKRLSNSNAVFDPVLPGLDYNQDQLFFMRYSQGYCHWPNSPLNFELDHAVHEYRAFQPLHHSEFSNVFKCQGKNSNRFKLDTCQIFE